MNPPLKGEGDRSPQANGGGGYPPLPRPIVAEARRLRREMSPPEVMLWQRLRGRPNGLKFRRQHPVGCYIADFYCRSASLIIEVDGKVHDDEEQSARDAERDTEIVARGYRVLRVPAREVFRDADEVARAILAWAESPLHHPLAPGAPAGGPPPRSGEEKE